MAGREPDQGQVPPSAERLDGEAEPDSSNGPTRLSIGGSFDDGFSLEPLGVSDGFVSMRRSVDIAINPNPNASLPERRNSARNEDAGILPIPSKQPRASTSKPPRRTDSLTLRFDTRTSQIPSRITSMASDSAASASSDRPQRPLSIASSPDMVRTQSPYQGVTGPTHPYGMYPQGTAPVRSSTVTTASTVQVPERTYSGPASVAAVTAPRHPYALYPQGTTADGAGEAARLPELNIPVGFTGLGQRYERRLGPEGEEAADIIGPDGHTEQLPPYTRYPDQIPLKASNPAGATAAAVGANAAAAGAAASAGEASNSQESINSPDSRLSTRSMMSESSRARLNNNPVAPQSTSTQIVTEKTTREKAKKRICGGKVPVWVVVLVVIFFLICIILLGGIIGGMNAHRKKEEAVEESAAPARLNSTSAPSTTTVTATLFDSSPLPSAPPGLPSPPVGKYAIGLGTAQKGSNKCVADYEERKAWSCSLPGPRMEISVSGIPGVSTLSVQLSSTDESDVPVVYGLQPPVVSAPQRLSLNMDQDDMEAGPALVAQTLYDKLVVLQESYFDPHGHSKREVDVTSAGALHAREDEDDYSFDVAGPTPSPHQRIIVGDRPWFCFWNDTVLDVFIYPMQNSSQVTVSSSVSTTTAAPALKRSDRSFSNLFSSDLYRRDDSYAPYPKAIKIEEHRTTEYVDSKPYCEQKQLLADNTFGPLPNAPETIHLDETYLTPRKPRRRWLAADPVHASTSSSNPHKRRASSESCHCEWTVD
ncbi:MAG: hypothetical protein M1825_000848 [Sarcosagium campestre]|nr:MAG: hypothetical protein M1825_000848 [Sarcosagium campestre]